MDYKVSRLAQISDQERYVFVRYWQDNKGKWHSEAFLPRKETFEWIEFPEGGEFPSPGYTLCFSGSNKWFNTTSDLGQMLLDEMIASGYKPTEAHHGGQVKVLEKQVEYLQRIHEKFVDATTRAKGGDAECR